MNTNFDQEIDTSGLNCPLPILRAKKAISSMPSGQVLKVIATDPGSVRDFEAFSKQTGHTLLEKTSTKNQYVFYMQKK